MRSDPSALALTPDVVRSNVGKDISFIKMAIC